MIKLPSRLKHLSVLSLLLLFVLPPAHAQIEKHSLWRDAVVTDMDVDFGGTGFHANYHFQRCDCGDLYIQVEQDAPDSIEKGDLLMIGGQTLLSRGFAGQGSDIALLMQAPLLMLQLVDALLNRSQPDGPFVVDSKQKWNAKEPKIDFSLNTGFAVGSFLAPWSVEGTGWNTAEGHRRFELTFEFVAPTEEDPDATSYIKFSGNLNFMDVAFPIPETTVMSGWHIQHFAAGEDESKPFSGGLTLKELRAEVTAQ